MRTGSTRRRSVGARIRILVADDHPAALLGICATLERTGSYTVVGQARTTDELLELVENIDAEVLVTDFSMPIGTEADGLHLLGRILRQHRSLRVIVLSMIRHTATLKALLRIGVIGLVDKHGPLQDISKAIDRAMVGRAFLSHAYAIQLDPAACRPPRCDDLLSAHEVEVIRRFAGGTSLAEIAVLLHRSRKTISRQKRDAMRKLQLKSDTELIDYARSWGFATP
ncbi:MAG TPA: response regulator transcription factor [Pinirhizobacter sp.]|uniref:response regulator transcription factor n=1 Tax=Pinirhizobacter sp. TaxID=2950432 RepID=UPI002BC2AF28|nr:response regulator transcription factor [Pinirhizobacter sp.]HMH67288.1 response regulator transcription factor [Pinirhizobacter sp.]